jgi:hypothetical protein
MATTTADERSGWGFWRVLGLFVLIVLAVLVALYFYNPTELRRAGSDAMDHARTYKRTIVSDYNRFYQCMRGGGTTTVAAVQEGERPPAPMPRALTEGAASPIVVYPPYPEYPAYPAYPDMPVPTGQAAQGAPAPQGMPAGPGMTGMPSQSAASAPSYSGYQRAPGYPQPTAGPQDPSGTTAPGVGGPFGLGPQGATPSAERFQGPSGGYELPQPGMQRAPYPPGMRMPGPPGGNTWRARPAPPAFGPGSGSQIMAQPGPGMAPPSMGMPVRPMPPSPQPGPYYERPMGGTAPGSRAPYGMTSPAGPGPQSAPPAAWIPGSPPAASMPPTREMTMPPQRESPMAPPREIGSAGAHEMPTPNLPATPPPVGMIVIPGPSSTAPVPQSVPPAPQAAMPPAQPQASAPPPAPAEAAPAPRSGEPTGMPVSPMAAAPAAPIVAQAPQPPQTAFGAPEPAVDPQIVAARLAFGRQQIQDSIRTYREYINKHHDSAMAFGELGNVLLAAGRPQEAAQAFYEASARLIDMGQPGNVYLLLPVIEQHDPLLAAVITRRLAALPRAYYY